MILRREVLGGGESIVKLDFSWYFFFQPRGNSTSIFINESPLIKHVRSPSSGGGGVVHFCQWHDMRISINRFFLMVQAPFSMLFYSLFIWKEFFCPYQVKPCNFSFQTSILANVFTKLLMCDRSHFSEAFQYFNMQLQPNIYTPFL